MKRYVKIKLHDGTSEALSHEQAFPAVVGLKLVKGDVTVWKGEEYMIVEL